MPSADTNPVGTLQEHAQARGGVFPQYNLLQAVGESHCPNFTMEVKFGELTAEGTAANKKQAKHEAARNILAIIKMEKEAFKGEKSDIEKEGNQEKDGNEIKEDTIETDDKPSLLTKVYTGNKIGELQEFCMRRVIGVPVYKDGETTGPSHMRHFTMVCVVGNMESVGEGGTKKEAKRQAAGAVLEVITSTSEKVEDTVRKDQNETKDSFKENSSDISKNGTSDQSECESAEQNVQDKFDEEANNQKIEELSISVVEDRDRENTEVADE